MTSRRGPTAPDFSHRIEIDVECAALHAFLCDLENYEPLHPLIESIEEIDPRSDLPGARRWRVVDRIPVGPFRMRTAYVAALEPVSDTEIRGHAWQSPGVRLRTVYSLSELAGGGTRLEERAFVRAPWGMRRFVVGQACASHATTLQRMKELLEGGEAKR